MNFVTTTSPNFGSGMISRFSALWRRDMSDLVLDLQNCGLLRPLRAVLGTALLAVLHALGVEDTAQDVVADAGKVLHAAAADHDHGVLLKVVAFARDVADHLVAVGETDLGDLAERRVRLLRGRGVDAGAHATLLRAG